MSSSNNSGNKRIRRDTNNTMQLQLSDLPEGILPKIASYLSNTSCVSFAMSLISNDAPISQEPSVMSKSIVNAVESWDVVDFKDIQDICGRTLTDNDIRLILLCIDGVNKIKSLKFTNCLEITGSGLQPLTGSTVLERIDLSLVGDYQNPTINPEPPISAELVVPILNSIVEREDNSLVHIQLPKKWRDERSNVLTQFLERFDRLSNERRYQCSRCGENCEDLFEDNTVYELVSWQEHRYKGYEQYGTVAMSCYLCKKNFCLRCDWDGEGASYCMYCGKFYCKECNYVEHCQGRHCTTVHQATSCAVCNKFKHCDKCLLEFCPECECEPADLVTCQFCSARCCGQCNSDLCLCRGEGCNRANCTQNECFDNNEGSQACVRDYEENCYVHSFCGDCYPGGMNVLGRRVSE